MKALAVAALLSAAVVVPSPALAQGNIDQAMSDTVCANLKRRGIWNADCEPSPGGQAYSNPFTQMRYEIEQVLVGHCSNSSGLVRNWGAVMRCMGLPSPVQVGKKGSPLDDFGGSFGGGGATGTWDCSAISFKLDAQGNVIIPSVPLKPGGLMEVGPSTSYDGGTPLWMSSGPSGSTIKQIHADSKAAHAKRWLHLQNMTREKRDWYGTRGSDANGYYTACTVAYRTGSTIVGRACLTVPSQTTHMSGYKLGTETGIEHQSCPVDGSGGGAFHFYGQNDATAQWPNGWNGPHVHGCIWYIPDYSLSASGYAINDETTLPGGALLDWPAQAPDHVKDCPIDPALIRKMTDGIWKRASERPEYDGPPYQEVKDEDVRPGPTEVGDLGNTPTTTLPPPNPNATPPTTSTPTTPPATVDLGPNPNTGAPEIGDAPTGIMDPIFNWLPDLPSITLENNDASCPVWNINMTEQFGVGGMWLLESHCPLLENNRAMIGALMIGLFGFGAAMIILRA